MNDILDPNRGSGGGQMKSGSISEKALCIARLDRVRVVSWAKRNWQLPNVAGFKVVRDTRVGQQGTVPTYGRVRELQSLSSTTRVWWQYKPLQGWLKAWRITWVGDDHAGIEPKELLQILKRCKFFRFLIVELALDFQPQSHVNRGFVKRHGRFGKSRRRTDRGGLGQLRYGSRKSGKLVRCYFKPEVNAFRVELELHSRLLGLKRRKDAKNFKIDEVPETILPDHIRGHVSFVRFRWLALERYLFRRFGEKSNSILAEARVKAHISLRAATSWLRKKEIPNVHRFLIRMRINEPIDDAITNWLLRFDDEWNRIC